MKDYGFEEVNAEISAELILAEATALERWLTTLEMEQDLSVANMVNPAQDEVFIDEYQEDICYEDDNNAILDNALFLTDEDQEDILRFEDDNNPILACAAKTLRMLSEHDPMGQNTSQQISYMPAGEDCAEWLQMHQQSIAAHVKSFARYMKGSGYELEDLVQEANLAIFNGWDSYNPATGSRTNFIWYIVYNRMRGLCRQTLSQKRDFTCTIPMDARTLAHSDFESSNESVVWSSAAEQAQFEANFATVDEITTAMKNLDDEERKILSMLAEGYTQTEIGNILGRSQSGVSYRVTEGRKALKEAIV